MTPSGGRRTNLPDRKSSFLLSSTPHDLTTVSKSLHDNIDVIESGYEFLLAYAAQGRESDDGPGGSEVRSTLADMSEAAQNIAAYLSSNESDFGTVVIEDVGKAGAAIALVLAQKKISSELVDNLNASIHLRALLTDLFLLSEAKT